jgi:predicted metal-dependent hydrolase
MQGDRRKAYRPLPLELREQAIEAGLVAYRRGEYFEAHELMEPAWMGTSELPERYLYQGLIKIAAAYVHAARGNPIGFARNLEGARRHLQSSQALDPAVAAASQIDLAQLLDDIDERLSAAPRVALMFAAGLGPLADLLPAAPIIR